MNRVAVRRVLGGLIGATALLACGDTVGPSGITCTPPAIPGCALVEGRVLTHDSVPAADVAVRVEPVASDDVFDSSSSQTDSVGRYRDKVLLFPGSALPDSAEARIVALRIPPPSRPVTQADTAHAVLPFAAHGERPAPVTVRLRLPPPPGP